MSTRISVYGGSGHAKVVIDAINSNPEMELGYIFDDNKDIYALLDIPVESPVNNDKLYSHPMVIAIGNNRIRKRISESFNGFYVPFVAHISAVISPDSRLENGTVILANAVVNNSAKIGRHCILNTGSVVEHDCILGDFVHLSPNAALAGGVQVGEGTHFGIGAVVIPGIKIGSWCTIGAGAVIIRDVPSYSTVVGNPGIIIKQVSKPDTEEKISSD